MCKNILEDDFIYTKDELITILDCLDTSISAITDLRDEHKGILRLFNNRFTKDYCKSMIVNYNEKLIALKKLRNNIKEKINGGLII